MLYAIFTAGFTAMTGQIVIIREFMSLFYGSELAAGLILGIWLLAGGAGSFAGGIITSKRGDDPSRLVTRLLIFTSFYLILVLAGIRMLPALTGMITGEIKGDLNVFLIVFPILLPLNGVLGALFPAACHAFRGKTGSYPVSKIYIAESLGAAAGGIMANFIMLPCFNSLTIQTILAAIILTGAYAVSAKKGTKILIFSLLGALIFFMPFTGGLNRKMLSFRYPRNSRIILSINSHYQKIEVIEREEINSLYTNGIYSFSSDDMPSSETSAHLALIQHPDPKRVLILGSPSPELIGEVLKYPVNKIEIAEIDPALTRTINSAFGYPADARLSVINRDPRKLLEQTDAKYDAVIYCIPPPVDFLNNRFYTIEFFRILASRLTSNGIVLIPLPSHPNYLSEEQRIFLETVKNTAETAFGQVRALPGETAYLIASGPDSFISLDLDTISLRLEKRSIHTVYFRDYFLPDTLSPLRLANFSRCLETDDKVKINRDFNPVACYLNTLLWGSQFRLSLVNMLEQTDSGKIFASCLGLLLLALFPVYTRRKRPVYSLLFAVSSTGFAELAFQIITLAGFQIIFGTLFWKMGILFASFMAGLITGTLYISPRLARNELLQGKLLQTQMAIAVYPLLLPAALKLFSTAGKGEYLLLLMPLIPGFLGGLQFPLICRSYQRLTNKEAGTAGGLFYALDLMGACAGAVIISTLILPLMGFLNTSLLVFAINLTALILIINMKRTSR